MPTDVRSKRTPSSGSNIWTDPSRSKRRQIVKTIRNPNLAGAQGLSSAKSASTRTRFKELQKRTRRAFLWYDLRRRQRPQAFEFSNDFWGTGAHGTSRYSEFCPLSSSYLTCPLSCFPFSLQAPRFALSSPRRALLNVLKFPFRV